MKRSKNGVVLALFLTSVLVSACSSDGGGEDHKGAIEKTTDQAAQHMVDSIRTPLEKAQSTRDQEEQRYRDMEQALKEK